MKGSPESRIIKLTASALAHGRINLRACGRDFFPPEAFGNHRKANGTCSLLRLTIKGFDTPVDTDIPTDSAGRPRWFFRNRGWVRPFVKLHRLVPGAKLSIRRLSDTEYEIAPFSEEADVALFPSSAPVTPEHSPFLTGNARRGKNGDLNKLSPEDRPAHDWYRFVLSYPPHLVRDYLYRFRITRRQRVLDPFCGTGTTLVECKKLGIPSIGIEANPIAYFASKIKTTWNIDPDALLAHADSVARDAICRLREDGIHDNPALLTGDLPSKLKTIEPELMDLLLKDSISPLPLHKTLVLLEALRRQSDERYDGHERLALAKALVYLISNLHFGPEVGVGPPKPDAPVISSWQSCVRTIAEDLRVLRRCPRAVAKILNADSRQLDEILEPESIDAVVTSPPYPNEKDYTRTTRLESVLLGFIRSKADLQALKKSLVRSNTRSVYKDDDDDRWIADHPEISRIADAIEARRLELGKTSGFERMYPRVTRLYFGGMARHLAHLSTVLRKGAQLAYVVGDQASYLRVMIRTGHLLAKIAESLGYQVVATDLFRTRLATATGEQLREEVVVLRWHGKPADLTHLRRGKASLFP